MSQLKNNNKSNFINLWEDYLSWQKQVITVPDSRYDLNYDGFIWPFLPNGRVWKQPSKTEINNFNLELPHQKSELWKRRNRGCLRNPNNCPQQYNDNINDRLPSSRNL